MKTTKTSISLFLSFAITLVTILAPAAQQASAQDTSSALQRGYRTGYSDGYMAGYRDKTDNLAHEVTRHSEYSDARRSYNSEYGSVEDYRDGYRQGFESGYNTGFEKRSYDSALPADLTRRGTAADARQTIRLTEPDTNGVDAVVKQVNYSPSQDDAVIVIPKDIEIIIELQEDLSTEKNREGDRFTARVVSPAEISGATIEGRIDRIQKPGRIKRRSQMLLAFDRIVMDKDRWSNLSAILTEVLPVKGDNVREVDDEGTAIGKSSTKDDGIKVGTTTGVGLGIGAVVAGPVGAAVGAGVGAAYGVGTVLTERGKHIRLNENQQLRIITNIETRIR